MYIIVGLGNPGKRYENTRHNIGIKVIDYLSQKHSIKVKKIKFKSYIGEGTINGEKVVLIKPQTYMNLSGEAVLDAVNFYKPSLSKLIIVFDDFDLLVGNMRIKYKGSAGSHNGMRSIIYLLRSDEFMRVKLGIKPLGNKKVTLRDFVTSEFTKDEMEVLKHKIMDSADAIEMIIDGKREDAMTIYNRKQVHD